MSTLLYMAEECGCLALVMVNNARNIRDNIDEIRMLAEEGRTLHEVASGALPPMQCDPHRRESAERASLVELGL